VGLKHNEDWRRIRSQIDSHFTASVAANSLSAIVADVTEWLGKLPTSPAVVRIEGLKQFSIEAISLASELPFKMIARHIFGDLLDDMVRILGQYPAYITSYPDRIALKRSPRSQRVA
jgi:gliotoxin/aspirochlorine/mycotoxins biosynthesis cytochrome P450 monooxygenase